MSRDLRFIDPAFTCEVILSGTESGLYESAEAEFERLKGIYSLGLLAQIHTVGRHSRHQHLIGLLRIFSKLCQQPKSKGLPKDFLWSFWCKLCFAQSGHAALSYDSEKGILLACHIDSTFKEKLRATLQPVIDSLKPCSKCSKQCELQSKGTKEAAAWFDDLVGQNQWKRLHLWVAALKLIQHPRLLSILQKQVISERNPLGFSESECLKLLVAPGCKWNRPVRDLNRLDFIPRDLAFAGTIGIRFDVDSLIAAADAPHPDRKLLESLSGYMTENIYESLKLQTTSVLYQRALAALLIKGKITLDAIFGLDLSLALNDEELTETVARSKAGEQVFDAMVRNEWRSWPVRTFIDAKYVPSQIEKEITGHARGCLDRHVSVKATCLKLQQPNVVALALCHRGHADRPTAKSFVKLCRSLLLKNLPRINTEDLSDALYEGLVALKCEHGLPEKIELLSRLNLAGNSLKDVARFVNRRAIAGSSGGGVSIRIGEFAYDLRGREGIEINVMHAAISGDPALRKNLGVSLEDAAEVLWGHLLQWQSLYFGMRFRSTLAKLLQDAQLLLARNVIKNAPTAGKDLECFTFLEALKHPAGAVSFRITLPNLKLINEDGAIENEYDVVSVILKDDKDVEVWVWGATTERNLIRKRNADHEKIQKLRDLLGNRWGHDVRTVICYVHRDGDSICLDIDGRQEKRSISL